MKAWVEINSATVYAVVGSFTIGRAKENRLVLHSQAASRRHAMIYGSDEAGYWVTDLASRNGTFLNEAPVKEPIRLSNKDRILIGNDILTFCRGERPAVDAETKPATKARANSSETGQPPTVMQFGVVALDQNCHIRRVTPNVLRWFSVYLPNETFSEKRLPATLEKWILHRQKSGAKSTNPGEDDAFQIKSGEAALTARLADAGLEEIILVFNEEQPCLTPAALVALGLTPREAEVMIWVEQDKTNSEIGIILGISAKTVEVHMYHIFGKLGVENRRQALSTVVDRVRAKGGSR